MAPQPEPTRVVMLKALVLNTETGFPAHHTVVQGFYKHSHPAPEEGWWWIGATPASAADIQRRGLHARGTLITTFFPPQVTNEIEENITLEHVPAIGSSEFLAEIHLSTEERRERMLERTAA